MNSEELELSLRTEFESYLKEVLAGIRRDVSDFQKNFEAEFEKHKSQMDEAFRGLGERFETSFEFDPAFRSSVEEHLRLARDEGATLTAAAFGEAEKLAKEAAAPAANFDQLRDAISDISSKTSQADILRSLTEHASNFAPRGVFFIVRNEQLIGWKAFGDEAGVTDDEVREIKFSIASDTLLSAAVESLATEDNSGKVYEDDGLFLEPLGYGTPDRMYAIPLVARGRGVAVLYADYGKEGIVLNPEALETLVKVAGMTVELMAASHPAPAPQPVHSQVAETAEETTEEHTPETAADANEVPVSEVESETAGSFEEFQAEHPQFETVEAKETEPEPASEPGFGYETIRIDAPDHTASFEPDASLGESPEVADEIESEESGAEETIREPETGFEFTTPVETEASVEPETYVSHETGYDFQPPVEPEASVEPETYVSHETGYDFQESVEPEASFEPETNVSHEIGYDFQSPAVPEASFEPGSPVDQAEDVPSFEAVAEPEVAVEDKEEPTYFEPVEEPVVEEPSAAEIETAQDVSFARTDERDNVEPFPVPDYSPRPDHVNGIRNGMVGVQTAEPAVEAVGVQPTPRIRFGERPVDLPIEVPDDERRVHNDARRFARLLVSEIKLYNEQKVAEGRQTGDLYERLREAIDRSRDMYDKRVQPVVASKFDYFHYELVNSLAEGEASKLGEGYPGAYLR